MAGGARDDRGVAGKIFAIADAFETGGALTLSDIAARAELPLSTAHRLLAEWVEWGGLVRGEDGRYRVGLKLWHLGVRQPMARRMRNAALPYLEDLLESTREHVHLAVRDGLWATYLERLSGPDAVPVISDVGSRLASARATGVAQCVEELTPGAFSVAAPVRDVTGAVVGAVSIVAHAERVAEPQFALGVRMAARGTSAALGWRS